MRRKIWIAAIAGSLLNGAAVAQTGSRITIEPAQPPARQGDLVRVQSSINLFVPGPTGDSEEATKNRERARRMVCEMAAKECDLLRDILARECRLEQVTVNVNRQSSERFEGYSVNGSLNLQITLK
jgi:hypothetical protein